MVDKIRRLVTLFILIAPIISYSITIYQSGRAVISNIYNNPKPIKKYYTDDIEDTWLYRVESLPKKINTNSILIESDPSDITWHSIYNKPNTIDNFINDNIGEEVYIKFKGESSSNKYQIISYNKESGDIVYKYVESIIKNLSNKKDIISLGYDGDNLLFGHQTPVLDIYSNQKRLDAISVSYIVPDIGWEPDYNLYIDSPTECTLNAGVRFTNRSGENFLESNIRLMHGDIKLPISDQMQYGTRFTARKSHLVEDGETFDHEAYIIKEKFDLIDGSINRYHNFNIRGLSYKKLYSFSHTITKRAHNESKGLKKAAIMYILSSNDIVDKSLPRGAIKIYEVLGKDYTLIGSDSFEIMENDSNIEIYTGTTPSVTVDFSIYERKKIGKDTLIKMKAVFFNNSDIIKNIEWNEYIYNEYRIKYSSLENTNFDSNSLRFNFELDAKSSVSHNLEILVYNR